MEIPIYIGEEKAGTLTITKQGRLTILSARLRDVGRVVRLSVFGEGEFYLGVPEPAQGELRLEKRLTEDAMRGFPAKPAYCAEKRREAEAEPKRCVLWLGGKPHYF